MKSNDQIIASELRAQIDHQITAADAFDSKATALAAATFALFTFTLPHVDVSSPLRGILAFSTVLFTLAAIGSFVRALTPRKGAFSYGASPDDMLTERPRQPDVFLQQFCEGLRDARNKNHTVLGTKATAITTGLWLLVAVAVSLAALLVAGGIQGA